MSSYRLTSRDRRPSRRLLQAGAALAVALCVVACLPKLLAPRAALLNTWDNTFLLEKAPDSRAMAGSTTKILTLYTALWAVSAGWVSLTDEVAISARAQEQGCQCLQDLDKNGVSDVMVGERFMFEDLLWAIAVSAGEATDAVAEHVASAMYHNGQKAVTKAQSEERMREFVAVANYFAQTQLGVYNTYVANVHGGDGCDFAIGCFDWNGQPCPTGALCDHGTTARDMATIWRNAAALQPMFEQILGLTYRVIPSKVLPTDTVPTKWYTIGKSYWYHPAVVADKNGASGGSKNSWIAQATSCGRTLIGVVLNAPFNTPNTNDGNWQGDNDLGNLFTWGFKQVCKTFISKKLGTVLPSYLSHGVAVHSDDIAATATVGGGKIQVATWDLTELQIDPSVVEIETAPPPPPPPGDPGDPEELVDAVFLTDSWLVTSSVEEGGIRLSSWRYPEPRNGNAAPAHAGDSFVEGPFASGRLLRLADDALLLATRDDTDAVALQVLVADVDAFYPIAQSAGAVLQATELELAGGPTVDPATGAAGDYEVVTATRTGGELVVTLWSVASDLSSIAQYASRALGEARNVAVVATGDPGDGGYATAATEGAGEGGPLRLQFWQASLPAGELALVEDATDGEWGKTERRVSLSPVDGAGPRSVLVTTQNEQTGKLRTSVWEALPRAETDFDLKVVQQDLFTHAADGLRVAAVPGTRRFVTTARNDRGALEAEMFSLGPESGPEI